MVAFLDIAVISIILRHATRGCGRHQRVRASRRLPRYLWPTSRASGVTLFSNGIDKRLDSRSRRYRVRPA